jgi:hypothetical protein
VGSGEDYLDEAIGDHADAAASASTASAAAPQAAARVAEEPPADLDRVMVTSSRLRSEAAAESAAVAGAASASALPPVGTDAALDPIDWLHRIRDRRDAGHVEDARASLRRFVREYPRYRLPDDLRPLLAAPR